MTAQKRVSVCRFVGLSLMLFLSGQRQVGKQLIQCLRSCYWNTKKVNATNVSIGREIGAEPTAALKVKKEPFFDQHGRKKISIQSLKAAVTLSPVSVTYPQKPSASVTPILSSRNLLQPTGLLPQKFVDIESFTAK